MNRNRWGILLSRATLLFALQLSLLVLVRGLGEIRIGRSDVCGRNPLISLAAAFGSGTPYNLNDVLRAVKADPIVWSQMQGLLRQYDSCIRAGEGLHFKRDSGFPGSSSSLSSTSGLFPIQQNQARDPFSPPQLRNVFETA